MMNKTEFKFMYEKLINPKKHKLYLKKKMYIERYFKKLKEFLLENPYYTQCSVCRINCIETLELVPNDRLQPDPLMGMKQASWLSKKNHLIEERASKVSTCKTTPIRIRSYSSLITGTTTPAEKMIFYIKLCTPYCLNCIRIKEYKNSTLYNLFEYGTWAGQKPKSDVQ
jgi:hypothetical protein